MLRSQERIAAGMGAGSVVAEGTGAEGRQTFAVGSDLNAAGRLSKTECPGMSD